VNAFSFRRSTPSNYHPQPFELTCLVWLLPRKVQNDCGFVLLTGTSTPWYFHFQPPSKFLVPFNVETTRKLKLLLLLFYV